MSASHTHTCSLADDGKVWCWGDNQFGELGDGTNENRGYPVWVRLPRPAVDLNSCYSQGCAVLDDGTAYCWPNGAAALEPAPVSAPGFHFTKISCGHLYTCAITTSATVVCWGNTKEGQCGIDGDATGVEQTPPVEVPHLDHVRAIDTGLTHTCALRSATPNLVCWGSNSFTSFTVDPGHINGKLGPAADGLRHSALPVAVDLGIPIFGLATGSESTYALTTYGAAYAWGSNMRKQLGTDEDAEWSSTPKPVMAVDAEQRPVALPNVGEVLRSSGAGACVKMADLTLNARYFCWGSDDHGELGFGTIGSMPYQYAMPTIVLPNSASNMARGDNHACVTVDDGTGIEIQCFGLSALVGNGTTDHKANQPRPTAVKWNSENAPGFLTR